MLPTLLILLATAPPPASPAAPPVAPPAAEYRDPDSFLGVPLQPRSFFERTVDLRQEQVARIQKHLLSLVEELRKKPMAELDAARRAARRRNLDTLERYARAGVFPRNHWFPGLRPVFIDDGGRACAVAHLMIESGAEETARRVAARENFDYVPDISTAGVAEWVARSGLTLDECARIQPAYPCSLLVAFSCASAGDDVLITWDVGDDELRLVGVYRDGVLVGGYYLDVPAPEYLDEDVPVGVHEYEVYLEDLDCCYDEFTCTVDHYTWQFVRGDVNGDGAVESIPDAIYLLGYAFTGGPPPPCMEATDCDGNGQLEPLSDALALISFGFFAGPPPAPPFPDCAVDAETATSLGCSTPPASCP